MVVGIWKSKSFWDRCEVYGAWIAGGLTTLAVLLPDKLKFWPPILAFLVASVVTVSKLRSKKIDETEKFITARRDKDTQDSWQRTISRLEGEAEAQEDRRNRELDELRDNYQARIKSVIGVLLEDLHARYFRNEKNNEEAHKHRTTLFACVDDEVITENRKRLVIHSRWGRYPNSTCSWPVDDNDPEKCRGVVGKFWFHGSTNVTTAACEWPSDPEDSVDKARYADSLGITVDEAEKLNVRSKVFTGVRIMVRGRRWGVILLDSAKDGHIQDKNYERLLLSEYAVLISSILERMES
jgi:hypothetical protein